MAVLKQLDLLAGIPFLAVLPTEERLVVERVDVAGAARHEELHHALGLGRMMQQLAAPRPASEAVSAASSRSPASKLASAMPPSPPPVSHRNCRRSMGPFAAWPGEFKLSRYRCSSMFQSMKTNSFRLNKHRHVSVRPNVRVYSPSFRDSSAVGGRSRRQLDGGGDLAFGIDAGWLRIRCGGVFGHPHHEAIVQQSQRL